MTSMVKVVGDHGDHDGSGDDGDNDKDDCEGPPVVCEAKDADDKQPSFCDAGGCLSSALSPCSSRGVDVAHDGVHMVVLPV